MKEQILFNSFAEALIVRGYGSRITTSLKARLRQCELDLDNLRPGYPAHLLPSWLDAMALELFPAQSRAEAHHAMGRRFIEGWKETLLGRALRPLIKLLPPKRALGRMERNFGSTDNFTRITLTDLGPTAISMRFNDILGVPDFYEGLLDEGASLASAKDARCRLQKLEAPGAVFLCEWSA
ncbi:MAG: DUF2378 family protein [Myxococcaceae bacterium]